MAIAKEMTRCPFCKEAVLRGASKCKHCHSELKPATASRTEYLSQFNTFRFGFVSGLLFMLVLASLAYFHFYGNP